MHVMCSLAWRQMRQQKRRTVITILGVIVAVAMIAAVSSFAATFTDLFVREKIAMDGDWHARISGTTAADREKIAADPRVRSVFVMGQHGVYSLPQRMGRIGQARIISLDAAGLDAMQVRLLSGAYPQQAGELLISDSFAKGAGLKTGDALTLLDETGAETRFTICGTASMTPLETVAAGEGCALIAQPEKTRLETGDAIIRLYKPDRGIYDWLQALCEGLPGEQRYDTHTSLLIYQGVSSNDTILATIYAMEAIIMVIILAAAVSLIYNAFAISVTDRAAQFGMLSSIGATMRQRRHAVLFEALTIALIAIPFGLVFGYLGIGITFAVVNSLMTELVTGSSSAALQLVVSPGAVALSVGLALITVLISAWIPARRAAHQLTAIINIFIYGFITLLSLVGAANIVGTISTSLLLRKREFAMVKSVGMGNRAFDRMIRCESAFYGLKAVAWGLAGSVVAVFLMWKAVGQSFSLPFQLPWVQMLIGVAAVFLLVALTMAYSVHKIRNDSIVEDLRLE